MRFMYSAQKKKLQKVASSMLEHLTWKPIDVPFACTWLLSSFGLLGANVLEQCATLSTSISSGGLAWPNENDKVY